MKRPVKEIDEYHVRLPPGMRQCLNQRAAETGRSMHAEVIKAIERHLLEPRKGNNMTQREFENALRILHSIDSCELDDPPWWPRFRDAPAYFFMQADDERAAKIWNVIEKRTTGKETMVAGPGPLFEEVLR